MKTKIIHVIFLLSAFVLFAQQPVYISLLEKDGVPGTDFFDVLEDEKGYIWLDGNKGVFRYDGNNFKKFQHKDQRGLSVFQIKKDSNNVIWYVNLSGQVFTIKNEKTTLFKDFKTVFKGVLPTLKIYKKHLVLFTSTTVLIYNIDSKKEVYKYHAKDLKIEPFFKNNHLFFGSVSDVITVDFNNFKSRHTRVAIDKQITAPLSVIISKDELIMVLATKNKLVAYKYDLDFKQQKKLTIKIPKLQIVKTKLINNTIWYCTEKGVYICTVEGNKLVTKRHLFKNTFITDVIIDKEQNYWFTTINKSIIIVPNIEINKVALFVNRGALINKMSLGNKEELLITTNKLNVFNLNTNTFKTKLKSFKKAGKILNTNFNPFKKQYVIATDLNTYIYDHAFNLKETLPYLGHLKKLTYLDKERVLATYPDNVAILKYPSKEADLLFKIKNRGYAVFYDAVNDLRYFSTINGLFVMDKSLQPKEILHHKKPIYISSITQTKDGKIWASSFKNGLFLINKEKAVKQFTANNGLLSNVINVIKADNNDVWILSEEGVQKYNTKNNTFQSITKNEGILSYNYTGVEIIKDNVYISTPNRIIYFNKNKVFKPYNTAEFYFTDIIINYKKEPVKNQYIFPYDKSNIKISFNAIGFNSKDKARFKYRLKGAEKEWTKTNRGDNFIKYNALNSGNYILQVQNITADTSKIMTKEIKLTVTKPFWFKWWFYLILVVILLSIIRINNLKNTKISEAKRKNELKELEIEKQLVDLKLENFRSQMNPHFIFNALNSIQDYIITNNKNLAADYLGKFANLMRIYLNQSAQDVITLHEEITTLNQYLELEKLRFEKLFNYKLIINSNLNTKAIKIPTMLIQPYVENAIKHGLLHVKGKKILTISFSKKEDKLECIIEDNGIGREKSKIIQQKKHKKYKSFATNANKARLDLLNNDNGKIEVKTIDLFKNKQPKGTKVIIIFPLYL